MFSRFYDQKIKEIASGDSTLNIGSGQRFQKQQ